MGNESILNRVFTQNTFRELIQNQQHEVYSSIVRDYIEKPCDKSNLQLIGEVYNILKHEYRNEYFYKNTMLNKLLLGIHSLNTTTALTEIRINKSKADFILVNGNAVVYEIKSELDNLDRLKDQIDDYYMGFSCVAVVTCEQNYLAVERMLEGTGVGIYVLNRKNQLSCRKQLVEDVSRLNKQTMFKVLIMAEYESLLSEYYGSLPNVTQFQYYKVCKQWFCDIDIKVAYLLYLQQLKKRNRINIVAYEQIPYELKSLVYFSKMSSDEYTKLASFLVDKHMGRT